jgi:hypothetical protein
MSKPLKPPRESDERAKLWRALRMMRTATTGELSAVTERTLGAVQSDLQRLARTGFVAAGDQRAGKRLQEKVWRLVRDHGPKPPLLLWDKDRLLIGALDCNTRTTYGADGKDAPQDLGRRHNRLPKRRLVPGREPAR